MRTLVIAAHPDDEVLGCGGTIARQAAEGGDVFIAILGEGVTSRYATGAQADPAEIAALHQVARSVCATLGAKELFQFNFPDNRFDTVPLLDIVKVLETLIEKVNPDTIYTHHAGDLNVDHIIINRAVLTATRPTSPTSVRDLYTFEVPSATDWSFHSLQQSFRPDVFVDINGTLETKIRAMNLYETEMRAFPHPRSAQALRALAEWRGSICGRRAAEAFETVRSIR